MDHVSKSQRIFVSYARADWTEYVAPLSQALRQAGFDVWIDQDMIRGGDDWLDKINEALDECRLLVLCVSPGALNSRFVKMEYRYFIGEDKSIVPVMCEDTRLPAELRGIQHVRHDDRKGLLESIRQHLS